MVQAKESTRKIKLEDGFKDAWVCLCGSRNFYPCTDLGREVEPILEYWNGVFYKCDRCGVIINQNTLEILES